jgi:glycosidase
VNWVWFQPIHPCGFNGRQIDPDTGQIFEVGSPYAVKNFFQVSPLLAKSYTPSAIYNPNDPGENAGRAAAMTEFQGFVAAADTAGVSVMLDAPFNHTSYDSELSGAGVTYISPGADPRSLLTSIDTRVYSRNADYCQRATLASGQGPAVAPDRGDFGKFADVYDVFFGRYSALVCQNPSDNGNYLNESDSFFYTDSNWTSVDRTITIDGGNHNINVTQNMWKFFSDYVLFWLDQTGCPAGTSVADQAYKGIDGLRADFGQGLPPQCWEYIINKARTRKWAFVFMSESLDGGAVTYRSGRHFDVLNENIVFPYQQAANATDYRNIYENRRNAYGQALVLMNNTSHDEENYQDPYQALIRYMTAGTIDGAPMIFMGQELGVSRTFGFDRYETNFGKQIAHFKKYNSMQPIFAPVNRTYALDQLYPVYAAIGQARAFSRALRSSNRYFVDQIGGGAQPNIFSVAKYETANASPNYADVVFGFVNLDRNNNQQGSFNVNITQNGSNLFGIKAGRTYNVKNIAAYTAIDNTRRDQYLIPGNISGTNLLNNGLFVLLKKVPALDSGWSTDPFEAQYLKLYDVTPPPVPNAPTTPAAYAVGHTVVFNWAAVSDPDGGILGYNLSVGTAPGTHDVFGPTFVGNVTTYSISNVPYGVTLYASIGAVSNAGVSGLSSMSSAPVVVLDPSADSDHDGVSNMDEVAAGTNPLDPNSVFRITGITRPDPTHVSVTWSSVNGKQYVIQSAGAPGGTYVDVPGSLISAGGPSTSETISGTMPVYYRVRIGP